MRPVHLRWCVLALVLLAACGESADEAGGAGPDGGAPPLGDCFTDADCPTGLVCNDQRRCVDDTGLPPEEEDPRRAIRPEASAERLYVLAPAADAVTLIDPLTLDLESVAVPEDPVDLEVVPGEDAAVVLSGDGRAVSFLAVDAGQVSLVSQRTPRRYAAVALAPDGTRAVLWTPDGVVPDAGAEGIVALVDVTALRNGGEAAIEEFAAGRRHAGVRFREVAGVAVDAVVIGSDEVAVFALDAEEPGPVRVALPPTFAEPSTREAVAAPDGSFLLLRSLAALELAVFDVATRTLSTLPLPAAATDLDVTEDGSLAVAVLRSTSQVAVFPLPAALTDPGAIALFAVGLPVTFCEVPPCADAPPGQVSLAPDGSFAVLFTSAAPTEAIALFRPADGTATVFDRLQKQVQAVALANDGTSAVVLHRPQPDSTVADLYERQVDQSEGYSVVDLEAGTVQLKLTDTQAPQEVVFAPGDRYAGVTLRDDEGGTFGLDAIDLDTLVTRALPLASAPEFAGPLPGPTPELENRIWVTQEHRAGRISVVELDAGDVRTITGFELNSEVR